MKLLIKTRSKKIIVEWKISRQNKIKPRDIFKTKCMLRCSEYLQELGSEFNTELAFAWKGHPYMSLHKLTHDPEVYLYPGIVDKRLRYILPLKWHEGSVIHGNMLTSTLTFLKAKWPISCSTVWTKGTLLECDSVRANP